MIKPNQHILWAILTLILVFPGYSQTSNYVFTNYTIEDGLPSNECYEVLQDSRGYIWVATDRGVARFDGYDFKVYQKEEGLGDPVIFHMQEDEQGRIWMGGLKNDMYIYYPDLDSMREYPHNHLIKEHSTHRLEYLKRFYKSSDTLYVGLRNQGILKINEQGEYELEAFCDPIKHYLWNIWDKTYMIRQEFGQLGRGVNRQMNRVTIFDEEIACQDQNEISLPIINNHKRVNYYGNRFDSTYFFYVGAHLYTLSDTLNHLGPYNKFNHIAQTIEGKFVLSFDFEDGVIMFADEQLSQSDTLVSDISATYFLEDKNQGYWISTLDDGILYIPKIKVKYLDQFHKKKYFNQLCKAQGNKLLSATFNGQIYQHDLVNKQTRLISNQGRDIFFIAYDSRRDEIWFSHDTLKYIDSRGEHDYILGQDMGFPVASKSVNIDENSLLFGTITRWGKIDLDTKETISYSYNDSTDVLYPRIEVVFTLDSTIYLGTQRGLYIIGPNGSKSLFFNNPVSTRIENIEKLNDDVLILGTKGHGIILFDIRINESIRRFGIDEGLTSNSIEDIYIDSLGALWLSTLNGINQLELDEDWNIVKLRKFNRYTGLPSNQIYATVSLGNTIYCATGEGVVEFDRQQNVDSSPVPLVVSYNPPSVISRFDLFRRNMKNENSFNISYLTLNYALDGNILYRYRLNGQDWIETINRRLNFFDLSPSDYLLEIQSQNEVGLWSTSLEIPFVIYPPWWKTWWFRISLFLLGMVSIFLMMNRRIQNRKKQNEIKYEIQRLEKLALKSQMNPHFIFNSLNSIQHFIMGNEKDVAMEYLSMFARLIRMTLNMANQEKVKVEEEIELLEHYLDLEKMRFEGRFDYSIEINNIDILNSFLPPMLIQPIVENAVVHGIKSKINGGKIKVVFQRRDNLIIVDVYDNGPGFKTEITTDSTRKTYGLNITRKRLKLNSITQKRSGRIEIGRTGDQWTRVSLFIPYEGNKK